MYSLECGSELSCTAQPKTASASERPGQIDWCGLRSSSFQILPDGNPNKISRMGTLSRVGHPSFPARLSIRATSSATLRDRDRRASTAATGRGNDPSIPESLRGRARGVLAGRSGPDGRETPAARGGRQVMLGISREQENMRTRITRAEI
jgi:hypothetical protein